MGDSALPGDHSRTASALPALSAPAGTALGMSRMLDRTPFWALATVCLRLSVLSAHEPMYKCIDAPMFLSRGDTGGSQSQASSRIDHLPFFDNLRACLGCDSGTDRCGRDARAPRWCILIWDRLYERANYAKTGMRSSGSVEGGDDLLFYALEGFDIARRDGTEHDLVHSGLDELADALDDMVERSGHRLGVLRLE